MTRHRRVCSYEPTLLRSCVNDALPPEVWAEMGAYALRDFGNPSSFHSYGRSAAMAVEQAREKIAHLLGSSAREIVFTSGGSESINLALRGAALANRKNGMGIVCSAIEHDASIRTCEALRAQGFRITFLVPDGQGRFSPEQACDAIGDDTAILSFIHANNEVGTIQPLGEIVAAVRRKKPLIIVHADAVQSVGHIPVLVDKLGVDLLSFTAHKFYGPKGIGGLYVRQGTRLQAEIVGGSQECGRRSGTESVPLIVGMAAALQAAVSEMEQHERGRRRPFRDQLEKDVLARVPDCRSNARSAERLDHFLSMSFRGVSGEDLVLALDQCGVAASTGSACNLSRNSVSHVLQALGVARCWSRGTLRLTFGHGCRDIDGNWLAKQIADRVEELRSICPPSSYAARGPVRFPEALHS